MTRDTKEYQREYYRAKRDYMNGRLDPNSAVGKGFIAETVVARTLGLDVKTNCNCIAGFGAKYDLYDEVDLGKINVKSSELRTQFDKRWNKEYSRWVFGLTNKYTPDNYVLVAYGYSRKNIEHVWIIPACVDIVANRKHLAIPSTRKGVSRLSEFEVDNFMYNINLHMMSINNCSVLKSKSEVPDFIHCI